MMKQLFIVFCCMCPVLSIAQMPLYNWTAPSQSCTMDDRENAIVADASGNSFVTGAFAGTIDMDPGPAVTSLAAGQYQNAHIAKYDPNGNLLWAKIIYSSAQSEAYDIALDPSGNLVITGNFMGTIDFDPGAGVQSAICAGSSDGFVAKYDPNGNYLWAFSLPATAITGCTAIECDATGNVIITGYLQGTTDFDPGPGSQILSCTPQKENAFLAKYSAAGNYVSAFLLSSTTGLTIAMDLAITTAGSMVICGYFKDSTDFDPGPAVVMRTSHSGNNDAFIIQFDTSGNYQWDVIFGTAGTFQTGNDAALAICSDPSDNIIVTGHMRGTVDFDPSPASQTLYSSGSTDSYIAKYSPGGIYIWAFKMGGTGTDGGMSVHTDSSGAIFTTGIFWNTVDFDPGAASFTLTSGGIGSSDSYVASYKASGVFRFAFQLGGTNYLNNANAIAVESTSMYVAGSFSGTVDFDPDAASTTNITGAGGLGGTDLYVARYDDAVTRIDDHPYPATALNIYADGGAQQIEISLPENFSDARIEIYNSGGALIMSRETESNETTLNATGFSTGLYHCMVITADGLSFTRSFVYVPQQ